MKRLIRSPLTDHIFNLTERNLGVFMRVKGRVMRRAERGMAIRCA